jgi:anti-sigma factor ChrR (cupin superfamily)
MELLHGDISQRVAIHESELEWKPLWDGMSVKVLDRTGLDPLVTTTLISLEPGSQLAEHRHAAAEDVFCLSGSWSDEHGEYGPRSFVHSPAGSKHAPRSTDGVVLFSKTSLGHVGDSRFAVESAQGVWHPAQRPGLRIMMLHEYEFMRVALLQFPAGGRVQEHEHPDGEEFFVLDGAIEDEGGRYEKGTWVRQPPGSRHSAFAERGCTLLSFAGHLA